MLRYLLAGLVMLTACLQLPAQTNKKIRSLQREQTSLKKDIANQEQLLRTTKKDVHSQLSNLQVINAQIEGQQKYVNGIHAEITMLASDIGGLEKQLQLLENDLLECKRKYRRAGDYMYGNRMRFSKWQFILSAKNFRQMYRRMRYVTSFSKFQVAQGRVIQAKEAQVNAKRQELLGAKAEKDRLYAQGQQETRKLQAQQQERQQVIDKLNKKQRQLQASIAQQRKKYVALNARIDKLIKEEIAAAERRRKEAERRRKAEIARQKRLKAQREKAEAEKRKRAKVAAGKKSGSRSERSENAAATPKFHEPDNVDRALSNSFAANRGRLPIPVTGSYSITMHYGRYNVPGLNGVQLDSKGINITARPGAQARAVFKGEVTSIFHYGGMYNVIVRHGSYLSVYCNLSAVSVRKGQQVDTRQALGRIATDASGNCTLQFQLHKETTRLNPESWLGR